MTTAKILLIDIETSPIKALTWETYQTNVLKVVEPSKILSVAYKWLEDKTVEVKAICDYKGYKANVINDKTLVSDIWKVLDQADIVIAHNGLSFDIKKLNARFVINGLDAPSHYEIIDTLKVAKRYFKFDSNSLDSLGGYLDLGHKINNGGFDLWVKCMAGDTDAWSRMKAYNSQDIVLLEKVYLRLRPFMNGDHPDVNLISGSYNSMGCHICSSKRITKRGYSYTKTGRKQRYQCSDCGSWSVGPFEKVKKASGETPVEEEC